MKKFRSKIIIITFILISLFITFTPKQAFAAEGIEVNTSFGIDGELKTNLSVPVQIEVKNNFDKDFKGTVEILAPNESGTKDSYSQEVEIKKGETKKIIIPVNNLTQGNKVKIKVSQDDSILFEKEMLVSSKTIDEYGKITIGTFTEEKDSLAYLSTLNSVDAKNYHISGGEVLQLSHELLSSNNKNLQMLDMIIINKFDSASFTDNEINALNTWVKNGGVLLIGGSEKTLNPLNKKIINGSIAPAVSTQVKIDTEEVNLNIGKLSGEIGAKILSDGDNTLVTRINNGAGSIILTSFDIGDKNFREISSINKVMVNILNEDFVRLFAGYRGSSGYPYEIDQILETVPLDKQINVSNVITLLIVFVVLASFGSYFLLKIINKRSYIWLVIPVLSVIFTVIMFNIGKETSINDKIVNSINIVNVDSEGKGKISSYLSIGNKYKSNLKIEEPEGIKIEHIVKSENMGMQSAVTNNGSDKVALKTIYNGDKTFYDFNEISALELKKFKIMGQEAKYSKVDTDLNFVDSGLSGNFKNPYDTDIDELYVVFGNNIFSTGQVKKGETYKFNSQKSISQNGISGYINGTYAEYFNSFNIDKPSDKFKGVIRNLNILSLINSNASKEPYYIALTKDKIDFGLDFGKEEISEYSQTAYVGNVKINLKDSEGNTVYPLGYIIPQAEQSESKGFFIDTTSYKSWESGEIVMKYDLGEKFIPKEITLDTIPVVEEQVFYMDKGDSSDLKFNGSIKIYNVKTDKFDDISYTAGTPLKLSNLDQYVVKGILKIKYIGKSEQGGVVPVITAKGRFQ